MTRIYSQPKTRPGGNDTEIQYNDGGSFAGDSKFTFDKTAKTVGVDNLLFNNTPTTTTGSTGLTYWDSDNHTLSTILEWGAVLQHGFELYTFGTDEGNNFPEGRAVSVKGATGNRVAFELTDCSDQDSVDNYIGLLTTAPDSGNRIATREGAVRGINTVGSGANKLTASDEVWAEGDWVYVDPSNAGYLTNVLPSAPHPVIRVGTVTNVHSNEGVIELDRLISPRLTSLQDVNGTALDTNGQLLVWDNDNGYFDFTENINNYIKNDGSNDPMTGDLSFNDNVKAVFGTDSDFSLYFDGGNNFEINNEASDLTKIVRFNQIAQMRQVATINGSNPVFFGIYNNEGGTSTNENVLFTFTPGPISSLAYGPGFKGVRYNVGDTSVQANRNYGLNFQVTKANTNLQALSIDSDGDMSVLAGDFSILNDNKKLYLGAGADSSIYYDGTDLNIIPDEVGTGILKLSNSNFNDNYGWNNLFIGYSSGNKSIPYNEYYGFNVGLGYATLTALTTGYQNVAIGGYAGLSLTTGVNNFLLGSYAGSQMTDSASNVLIGSISGQYLVGGNADNNVGIGSETLRYNLNSGDNIAIGFAAIKGVSGSKTNNSYNVAIGTSSFAAITSTINGDVGIGWRTGGAMLSGSYNTFLGYRAGDGPTGGSNNVFIGKDVGRNETTPSSKLMIDESNTSTPLIYGEFNNRIIRFGEDNTKTYWGTGNNASIYYNGTNLIIDPQAVGTGYLNVQGPVKIDDIGSLLATPQAGTFEFDNDRMYLTNVGTQRAIDRTSDVITSTTSVSNTTDETTIFTGTIGANDLKVGNVLKINANGVYSTNDAANSVTIKVYIGATEVGSITPNTGVVSDQPWELDVIMTARSVGATGSVAVYINGKSNGVTGSYASIETVDTTDASNITITAQWDTADADDIVSIYQGFMEFKN